MNYSIDGFLSRDHKVAVVGLGYVGLPLAVHFARRYRVLGYDISTLRVQELTEGHDRTGEVSSDELKEVSESISFTADPADLATASVIIVTVPTPIDEYKIPDLRPVMSATATVGQHMSRGALVVYESTVYPGVTEDECVPVLEERSGLRWKEDFHVGYSPERINPGDKKHTFDRIVKVVAGDTPAVTHFMAELYGRVVLAGIHEAPSIKTAEASKVIENTQRDVNIALMNELSLIFDRMGLDTWDVLEAARTKWNFLPFEPGLVGGHCIGVDPYYLTFKAESLGYHPYVILAGRRINDGMGRHVAQMAVKMLIRSGRQVAGARVAVLGLTFKENIPDIRNTRVVDVIEELRDYGLEPVVHDPRADASEVRHEYGIELVQSLEGPFDAVILAVKHDEYREMGLEGIATLMKEPRVLLDVKAMFDRQQAQEVGFMYWRL